VPDGSWRGCRPDSWRRTTKGYPAVDARRRPLAIRLTARQAGEQARNRCLRWIASPSGRHQPGCPRRADPERTCFCPSRPASPCVAGRSEPYPLTPLPGRRSRRQAFPGGYPGPAIPVRAASAPSRNRAPSASSGGEALPAGGTRRGRNHRTGIVPADLLAGLIHRTSPGRGWRELLTG
jgi:hypothetical protein